MAAETTTTITTTSAGFLKYVKQKRDGREVVMEHTAVEHTWLTVWLSNTNHQ
jgi:hypothetical protein